MTHHRPHPRPTTTRDDIPAFFYADVAHRTLEQFGRDLDWFVGQEIRRFRLRVGPDAPPGWWAVKDDPVRYCWRVFFVVGLEPPPPVPDWVPEDGWRPESEAPR